jgi:hypothetical protein
MPDYVIGSDNEITLAVDGASVPTSPLAAGTLGACEISYDYQQDNRYLLRRPMLAARLWPDPADPMLQQLVIGSTHAGLTPGKLSILNVTPAGTLNCLAVVSGEKPQFGHALAIGDVDNDKSPDLLVGAPGQQAFVYRGWAALPIGTVPPTPIPIAPPGGVDFGFAVLAMDIDDDPGDEVLVSDPRASVDGQTGAGHVLVYKYNPATMQMDQIEELRDLSPEANANFGYTLNALSFCRPDPLMPTLPPSVPCRADLTSRILLVGAGNEVFLYYRVGENIPIQPGQTLPDVRTP